MEGLWSLLGIIFEDSQGQTLDWWPGKTEESGDISPGRLDLDGSEEVPVNCLWSGATMGEREYHGLQQQIGIHNECYRKAIGGA